VSGSSEVPHAIVFNPSHPSAPILCAPSWLCRVDTGAQTPPAAAAESHSTAATASGGAAIKAKKRHRHEGAEPSTGAGAGEPESHVIRSYGGMLLFDFIAPGTALVIEQPWLRVMDLFPPALYKHRFGT
jgi:U3 small nucleolar RNA-associated protein 4